VPGLNLALIASQAFPSHSQPLKQIMKSASSRAWMQQFFHHQINQAPKNRNRLVNPSKY
jgi:hypothetical protein